MDQETLTVSVLGTVKRQTALFIRLAETHYRDRRKHMGVNKTLQEHKKLREREREREGDGVEERDYREMDEG